uniref:FHA domain-containing protein n=2 Tax=Kalanchoe fedtschenkoi TaxID=63787 RepID=A0A7N0R9N6_KALFE
MGALAQVPVIWTPEDDFRLKNAIEVGASLESLAKGAVQFSRRFTLQEIKERWVSILYDPVISAEVSVHVMEIERSSSSLPQKSFRFGGLKDNKCNFKKIKTESIRDHYYSVRKRIRYENCRSMEMELADGQIYSSDHNYGMDPTKNCIIRDPNSNQFEHPQSDAGLTDPCFTHINADGVATSSTGATIQPFHAPHHQFISETFPVERGILPKECPQIFGEASLLDDCFQVEKMGILEDVNMCGANSVSADPHSILDQINGSGDLLEEFDGSLPDCGVSFDNLEYPSPLPEMHVWDTMEDISAPIMPAIDNLAAQSHNASNILALPEGGQSLDTYIPDYDGGPAESQFPVQNCDGDPRPSDSDDFLAELDNFLDGEYLVMDANDIPSNDNPFYEGFSSLLLNSPMDADGDKSNILPKPLSSAPSDLLQATMDGVDPVVFCLSGASRADEAQPSHCSDSQLSIFSIPSHCQSPDEKSGFVACIVNTEEPVVPNNDDIILPHVSLSVKDLLERRNHWETASDSFNRGQKNLGKPEVSSETQIYQLAIGKSCNYASVDCKAPNSLPKLGKDISPRSSSLLPDLTNGEHPELVISRGSDNCLGDVASPSATNRWSNNLDNQLGNTPDGQPVSSGPDCYNLSVQETVAHPLLEFEEHVQESDDEIPYYSDVEEMVLEMDLGPVDQDIELKDKVSKYQSLDARKQIIRLEQAAHSYMQRTIARRGALAVIYGRNSKHYIKKSEVLLGRGTNVFRVDVDLGAEGRAHKVSRRQAVIKLDADGKFYIKNLGKHPIYKNSLEVASGQTVRLQSGNLLEIQKITLIFEDNPTCVRRHLKSLQKAVETVNTC